MLLFYFIQSAIVGLLLRLVDLFQGLYFLLQRLHGVFLLRSLILCLKQLRAQFYKLFLVLFLHPFSLINQPVDSHLSRACKLLRICYERLLMLDLIGLDRVQILVLVDVLAQNQILLV